MIHTKKGSVTITSNESSQALFQLPKVPLLGKVWLLCMECVCLKVHTHVLYCSRGEGVETSRALRTPNPGPPSLPFYPVLIEPYSLDLEKEVTLSTEKCSEVDTGKRAWGAPL